MSANERFGKYQKAFVLGLVIWAVVRTALALIALWSTRVMRAEMEMASGLVLLWIGLGGSLMYLLHERIKMLARPLFTHWRISFFLFSVALAMTEEVVTTLMTNCAPLFGVQMGEAYITASANYFDVICFHSVVVFLPAFAAWTRLFSRYDFSPFETFVCFGIYGFIGESIFGGLDLFAAGFWILVYGLMIWLPAYVFADFRGNRPVTWRQYLMGAVGPCICTIPWVLLLKFTILRHHPDIHFPKIQTN